MTYNFTNTTFCPQPFSNIQISVQGLYKICCLANDDAERGHALDENGNYMHVLDHSIMDAINSVKHREHRLEFSKNLEPERCVNCYEKEKASNGSGSLRQSRLIMTERIVEFVRPETAASKMNPDGSVNELPVALDVRFGSLCNAKCIMCNPGHSSLWNEDWKAIKNTTTIEMFRQPLVKFGAAQRWWETDKWWERFEEIAPSLRSLHPVGGEPLIVPEHDTMLEKLVEWDYAKNIELEYDTNLTVINPRLIKLWKQFKGIVLRFSLDETNERFYLVRFPSNYDRVLKNVETLKAEGIPIKGFTSSIGLATIYSPFRLVEFSRKYNIPYILRFLYTPPFMNIAILPKSAKMEIIETYAKNLDKTGSIGESVIHYLKNSFNRHEPELIKEFVSFMNKLDELRGTDWKQTLPDVYSLLTRHCPEAL